jgi:hypothetical protein
MKPFLRTLYNVKFYKHVVRFGIEPVRVLFLFDQFGVFKLSVGMFLCGVKPVGFVPRKGLHEMLIRFDLVVRSFVLAFRERLVTPLKWR